MDAVSRFIAEPRRSNIRRLLIGSRKVGKSIAVFQDNGMDLMHEILCSFNDYNQLIKKRLEGRISYEGFKSNSRSIFLKIERKLDDLEDIAQARKQEISKIIYVHRDIIRDQRLAPRNISCISERSWGSVVLGWLPFTTPGQAARLLNYTEKMHNCVESLLRAQYELEAVLGTIYNLRTNIIVRGRPIEQKFTLEGDGEKLDDIWEEILEIGLHEGRRKIELWQSKKGKFKESVRQSLSIGKTIFLDETGK